jgi:hypothetical protein
MAFGFFIDLIIIFLNYYLIYKPRKIRRALFVIILISALLKDYFSRNDTIVAVIVSALPSFTGTTSP